MASHPIQALAGIGGEVQRNGLIRHHADRQGVFVHAVAQGQGIGFLLQIFPAGQSAVVQIEAEAAGIVGQQQLHPAVLVRIEPQGIARVCLRLEPAVVEDAATGREVHVHPAHAAPAHGRGRLIYPAACADGRRIQFLILQLIPAVLVDKDAAERPELQGIVRPEEGGVGGVTAAQEAVVGDFIFILGITLPIAVPGGIVGQERREVNSNQAGVTRVRVRAAALPFRDGDRLRQHGHAPQGQDQPVFARRHHREGIFAHVPCLVDGLAVALHGAGFFQGQHPLTGEEAQGIAGVGQGQPHPEILGPGPIQFLGLGGKQHAVGVVGPNRDRTQRGKLLREGPSGGPALMVLREGKRHSSFLAVGIAQLRLEGVDVHTGADVQVQGFAENRALGVPLGIDLDLLNALDALNRDRGLGGHGDVARGVKGGHGVGILPIRLKACVGVAARVGDAGELLAVAVHQIACHRLVVGGTCPEELHPGADSRRIQGARRGGRLVIRHIDRGAVNLHRSGAQAVLALGDHTVDIRFLLRQIQIVIGSDGTMELGQLLPVAIDMEGRYEGLPVLPAQADVHAALRLRRKRHVGGNAHVVVHGEGYGAEGLALIDGIRRKGIFSAAGEGDGEDVAAAVIQDGGLRRHFRAVGLNAPQGDLRAGNAQHGKRRLAGSALRTGQIDCMLLKLVQHQEAARRLLIRDRAVVAIRADKADVRPVLARRKAAQLQTAPIVGGEGAALAGAEIVQLHRQRKERVSIIGVQELRQAQTAAQGLDLQLHRLHRQVFLLRRAHVKAVRALPLQQDVPRLRRNIVEHDVFRTPVAPVGAAAREDILIIIRGAEQQLVHGSGIHIDTAPGIEAHVLRRQQNRLAQHGGIEVIFAVRIVVFGLNGHKALRIQLQRLPGKRRTPSEDVNVPVRIEAAADQIRARRNIDLRGKRQEEGPVLMLQAEVTEHQGFSVHKDRRGDKLLRCRGIVHLPQGRRPGQRKDVHGSAARSVLGQYGDHDRVALVQTAQVIDVQIIVDRQRDLAAVVERPGGREGFDALPRARPVHRRVNAQGQGRDPVIQQPRLIVGGVPGWRELNRRRIAFLTAVQMKGDGKAVRLRVRRVQIVDLRAIGFIIPFAPWV